MTDKAWAMLKPSLGDRDLVCHHDGGENCTANNKGKCVCLYNTNFKTNVCPFYRDKRTMTEEQLHDYRKLFYYRGKDLK